MGMKFKWKPKEMLSKLKIFFSKRSGAKPEKKKREKKSYGKIFKSNKLQIEGISIKYKLLFNITALLICAMLITSTIMYISSSVTIFNQSKEEMKSLITRSIETISVMIEKEVSEAYAIANTKESSEILKNNESKDANVLSSNIGLININNKFFKEYLAANAHVDRISLIDITGKVISDSE